MLTADASLFSIGAILSHRLPNGLEPPIVYFHDYVYGHLFELVMDHQLLLGLLAGDWQTPLILSPRMSHWVVFLAAYNYSLVYCPGKLIAHADALSYCPLPISIIDPAPAPSILLIDELDEMFLTAMDITAHSRKDPMFAQVMDWMMRGLPLGQEAEQFVPFWV